MSDCFVSYTTATELVAYSTNIGDGVNNAFVVSHNFGTKDVSVTVRDTRTNLLAFPAIEVISLSAVSVSFNFVPDLTAYDVTLFAAASGLRATPFSDRVVINIEELPAQNVNVSVSGTGENVNIDIGGCTTQWGTIYGAITAQTDLWHYLSAGGGGSDSQTLSWSPVDYLLSISNGNTVSLASLSSTGGGTGRDDVNSLVVLNSASWNAAFANLVSNSAAYLTAVDLSFLSVSGNWNNSYTAVSLNSANWGAAYSIAAAYSTTSGSFATNTTLNAVSSLLTPLTLTNSLTGTLNTNLENYRTSVAASTATLLPTSVYQNTSGSFATTTTLNSVSGLLTPLTLTNSLTGLLDTNLENYRTTVALATSTLLPTSVYQNASGTFVTSTTLNSVSSLLTPLTLTNSLTGQLQSSINNKIALSNLSVSIGTPTGAGSLSYNNSSGVFTYLPTVTSAAYTLPTASASTLGGVKVGSGLAIDGSGVLSSSVVSGTNVSFNNVTTTGQIVETFQTYNTTINAAATATLNCAGGNLWNVTSTVNGNWYANFTNISLATNQATSITLVLNQGATAYIPASASVNSTPVTINWQGGTQPTPNSSKKDLAAFSVMQTGASTYLVFGQLVTFG